MPRLAYVNGHILPLSDASVPIEDRGYQLADGVYEVCAVLNGRLLDWDDHVARLNRSLSELRIAAPMSDAALGLQVRRLLKLNQTQDALLYIQVTRGAAKRDHLFPVHVRPMLTMTVRPFDFSQRLRQQQTGVGVITLPDQRWARCDIKSISLLPNVLAKQAAREAGAFEAWMIDGNGHVTEGGATNAWIVDASGAIVTRPLSNAILAGVMRDTLIRLARADGLTVEERLFTPAEALAAREAFLTSTTAPCVPIVTIDGQPIGLGKPGPVAARLAELLWGEIERQTGWRGRRR